MKTQKQESVRNIALFVIMETMEVGKKLNELLLLQQEIYQYLPKKERAFLNRLCRGCVERCLTLDYVINRYSSRKINKMKPVIRNILRMGTYEILFMEKVPDRAACNEAVLLSKRRGFSGLSGFVNGILRNISANKEEISELIKQEEKDISRFGKEGFAEYMERVYSIPKWLTGYWEESYERELIKKMGEDFLREKKTTIRVNTQKITVKELKSHLEENGVHTQKGEYSPYALVISEYDHIGSVEGFSQGWFQIQDESSMLSVLASGIGRRVHESEDKENRIKVLDICGAPGGKGLFYAQLLENSGSVSIRDISQKKLMLVEENALRLGIANIDLKVGDATESLPEDKEKYDIVAADLPCSGLGVIGKKCDVKYRMSMEDIKGLAELQRQILSCCASYLKPDGVLIYSTCTISPMENEKNAEWFLGAYPEFKPYDIGNHLDESLAPYLFSENDTEVQNMLRLIPGLNPTDGFFIAGFVRSQR